MKISKLRFSIIITLLLALVFSFSTFLFIANAEGNVTVSNTNVFSAVGDANVIADKQTEGEADVYYTSFTFAFNEDSVAYRRNLAYRWFEKGESEGGVESFMNLRFGFKNTAFEKFYVKFESDEYSKTKEGKTTNYVIFFPVEGEENKVYALITADKEATLPENATALNADSITVKFTSRTGSSYGVYVGSESASITGEFENVGGNYVKNSSSGIAPITFNPYFGEEASEGRTAAQVVFYELNGQVFKVNNPNHNEEKDYYYGGTVLDNVAPVLCLDGDICFIELGKKIDFKFTVIDVLRTAPSNEINYYLLTYEQYKNEGGESIDYNSADLFKKVDSTDDKLMVAGKDKYQPTAADLRGTAFEDEKLVADMLAKIYVKLTDTTASGESTDVYLDWYLKDNYKIKVNGSDFIAVANDKQGVTYNYGADWQAIKEEYQAKIDEAAKNLVAGENSYLYLPSVEKLFKENATSYENMTFSIYYWGSSQSSHTARKYNNLTISIANSGDYTFTVYALDAAGNNMYYIGKDGKVEEFASNKIWDMAKDEELADKLPWFTFNVKPTSVDFEKEPGLQSTAYVGTSYSPAGFKFVGESGKYTTKYRLFLFDRAAYYEATNKTLSYNEYVDMIDDLYNDNNSRRAYFTEIPAASTLVEGDENYDKFKAYEWSSTGTSFTPQDDNAFYLIRAEATDSRYGVVKSSNMGIVASVKAKTLKGENDWLEKNVASVILLAVAGVSLIGIILLLVIKPHDKGDVEAEFERAQTKRNKK